MGVMVKVVVVGVVEVVSEVVVVELVVVGSVEVVVPWKVLASPKSPILTVMLEERNMLPSLRSLWRTALLWRKWRPMTSWRP